MKNNFFLHILNLFCPNSLRFQYATAHGTSFPHHYSHFLQVRDVGWYGKDLKYAHIKFLPSQWRLQEIDTQQQNISVHRTTEKSLGSTIWAMLSKHAVWDKCPVHVYSHYLLLLMCSMCCDITCHNCCVLNTCSYIYFWSTELDYLVSSKLTLPPFILNMPKQLDHGKQTSNFTDSLNNLQLFEKALYLALLKSIHVLIVLLSTKASHTMQKQVAPTWKPPYNFYSFVQSVWCRTAVQGFPITNTLDNTCSLGNTHITISSSVLRWNMY